MGEPATPTPRERAEALALAKAIVEAETDDEIWPVPLGTLRPWQQEVVFRLAQDLVDVTAERDALLS